MKKFNIDIEKIERLTIEISARNEEEASEKAIDFMLEEDYKELESYNEEITLDIAETKIKSIEKIEKELQKLKEKDNESCNGDCECCEYFCQHCGNCWYEGEEEE